MSNKINELSPTFRDNLLRYNLAFADSVNGLTSLAHGIGRPITFSNNYEVRPSLSLLYFGDIEINQISNNKYLPPSLDRLSIEVNPYPLTHINGGYYLNGYINGFENLNTLDKISGLLNGDSFLDIQHTSLASFLSVKLGAKKDTELGKQGANNLWKLLGYRTLQNTYKNTAGKINFNLGSLLRGDDFIKADYRITRSNKKRGLESLIDPTLTILGLENPNKELSQMVSIFNYENPTVNISNKSSFILANSLLQETGVGQVELLKLQLTNNLDSKFNGGGNRYIPNLTIEGEKIGKEKHGGIDFEDQYVVIDENGEVIGEKYSTLGKRSGFEKVYNISTGFNRLKTQDDSSDNSPHDNNPRFRNFDLDAETFTSNKRSILDKTLKLFNNNKIGSILYDKGTTNFEESDVLHGYANSNRNFDGKALSKGAQYVYLDKLKPGSTENDPNKYFCRSWVNGFSYDRVSHLQKNRGIDKHGGLRKNIENSVLGDNGFVKISPYTNEFRQNSSNIKQYMFSIENLAWANDLLNLPEWEIGNGDPLTGTRGRIMWFPPYELSFSESTSVNYDTHHFIGRSEPVYTYNNAERTGQLSFKIIIDHPNFLNDTDKIKDEYKEFYDEALQSILAGCGHIPTPDGPSLSVLEKNVLDVENAAKEKIKVVETQKAPEGFNIYFPNDVAELLGTTNIDNMDTWYNTDWGDLSEAEKTKNYAWGMYEVLGSETAPWETFWEKTRTGKFTPGSITNSNGTYPDEKNYGLNAKWRNKDFLTKLSEQLKNECPACKVFITGYANVDGKKESNNKLGEARSRAVSDFLAATILKDDVVETSVRFGSKWETIKGGGESGNQDGSRQDSLYKKKNRYVTVSFKPDLAVQEAMNNANAVNEGIKVGEAKSKLGDALKSRFFNEALYFKKIMDTDKTVLDKFSERIEHFSPAFHSISPEGFNSRLTFLQQCTRQGSTILENSNRPNNMSFGMPPVCILRIGDFWNTKIIIDSLNIDYEQMWDINPEGIGVQPMIANVSLSFKMLGGSSMTGPINKLQNAISFNYYANTQMYDPRSDYFSLFKSDETMMKDSEGKPKLKLSMERGNYVNGMDDLYVLLGGKYVKAEKKVAETKVESNDVESSGLIDPNIIETPPIIEGNESPAAATSNSSKNPLKPNTMSSEPSDIRDGYNDINFRVDPLLDIDTEGFIGWD